MEKDTHGWENVLTVPPLHEVGGSGDPHSGRKEVTAGPRSEQDVTARSWQEGQDTHSGRVGQGNKDPIRRGVGRGQSPGPGWGGVGGKLADRRQRAP